MKNLCAYFDHDRAGIAAVTASVREAILAAAPADDTETEEDAG